MLATVATLAALSALSAAALSHPTDAKGSPVNRSRRTLWNDLRALVGAAAY